jgi:transposase
MIKRYELSDAQWQRIEALLPGKAGNPGRTAADNRLFVNSVAPDRFKGFWKDRVSPP